MTKKQIAAWLLCAAMLLLTGCAAGSRTAASSAAASGSSAAASATASPAPADQTGRMPLTGAENTTGVSSRPVAITISNAPGAYVRQWGLADASVVMEALTEGKTTNLMLWYDSIDAVPKVGPVSEGKDIFWQFALPENSLVAQRGSNAYAFNLLNCYAWQPLDALYTGVNCYDYDGSDPAMPAEYSWYTQGSTLRNGTAYYGLATEGDVPAWLNFGTARAGSGDGTLLTVQYSATAWTQLRYENGGYAMYRADGAAQCDANSGVQASYRNVLVLYCAAGVKDDRYTRDYDLTGGQGLYLTDGTWQTITWQKGDAAAPLQLFAADGSPLTVNTGKIYLAIYGGFAGQAISLYDSAGTAVDTGLTAPAAMATPAPTAAPTPAPTPDPAAATPDPAAAATPNPAAATPDPAAAATLDPAAQPAA